MNSDGKAEKILAYCMSCGSPQGTFSDEDELRLKIAEQNVCEKCGTEFGFVTNGRILNLHWELVSGKEGLDVSKFNLWEIVHKDIVNVAKVRFDDGHYADSVESAFKEVNKHVKEIVKIKTGEELDGARLMYKAFPNQNPVIVLDDLTTATGRNIQEGYMHIFAGAMLGIRNPKAHDNITISEERALHFILLASLLMHKLDEAQG